MQKVEWDAESGHAIFAVEAQVLKSEEVLADVFSKVTASELLTVIIESSHPICSNLVRVKGRSLYQVSTATF